MHNYKDSRENQYFKCFFPKPFTTIVILLNNAAGVFYLIKFLYTFFCPENYHRTISEFILRENLYYLSYRKKASFFCVTKTNSCTFLENILILINF